MTVKDMEGARWPRYEQIRARRRNALIDAAQGVDLFGSEFLRLIEDAKEEERLLAEMIAEGGYTLTLAKSLTRLIRMTLRMNRAVTRDNSAEIVHTTMWTTIHAARHDGADLPRPLIRACGSDETSSSFLIIWPGHVTATEEVKLLYSPTVDTAAPSAAVPPEPQGA